MRIAIIPARGGSKRIPRKNIKHFHGKPIIAYSIETALLSGCFDEVIVSTDDHEIAELAMKWGASVPFFRPAALADDYTGTIDVIAHAVTELEMQGHEIETVCCLYPTAPFLQPDDLRKGLSLLQCSLANYVFSATAFDFPIQRAVKIAEDGKVGMFFPEHEHTRSQDLEDAYHDAGQFYWGRASAFKQKLPVFTSNARALVLPRTRVQDIDTPDDWAFAEKLFLAMEKDV